MGLTKMKNLMSTVTTCAQAMAGEEVKPTESPKAPPEFRFIYPEFLPRPEAHVRNRLREKLERQDMLRRRSVIDIPEFYVGSIMAVTVSDENAQGKQNRFVGICILRELQGLRANVTLRNVVEHQGVEIKYEMYNPVIQKIEVLRLERRLDDDLRYLRDAPLHYSTFPFDVEPETLPEGSSIPINTLKVQLNPRPWTWRWERCHLQGVEPIDLPERFFDKAKKVDKPWEEFDLMLHYRRTIPEEEQRSILTEVASQEQQHNSHKRQIGRKRVFQRPKKTA